MELQAVTEPFQDFLDLWNSAPTDQLQEFLSNHDNPTIGDFEEICKELYEIEKSLMSLYDIYYIGPLEVHTNSFKYVALRRLREHQQIFVDLCVERLINPVLMDMVQIEMTDRALSKVPETLTEIDLAMKAISNFRDIEITVLMKIMTAEVRINWCLLFQRETLLLSVLQFSGVISQAYCFEDETTPN